ncbi:MAG: tandem-95 repeat protein [Oxalobacteraceae bacterium]|nr:MAG: tandem-95 repeat protein [Oxalobacteraceae bacterium]
MAHGWLFGQFCRCPEHLQPGIGGRPAHRLLAINTSPDSNQYGKPVTFKTGSVLSDSPFGVSGMAIGPDGRTLVVAAPTQANTVSMGDRNKRGNVLVFDLDTLDLRTGKIDAPIIASLPSDGLSGKSPQVVTATRDSGRFLIGNVMDYTRGLGTLTITRDEKTDALKSAKLEAVRMAQYDKDVVIDRLDIQRAQSAVLVEFEGEEYAIVADDNQNFRDPLYNAQFAVPNFVFTPKGFPLAVGGSVDAKKVAVGGKLGIVKDPFGLKGEPTYMGATLPLDGYGIINLSLSPDHNVLLGQLSGGFSARDTWSKQLPHQSGAWNVSQLIEAAKAHSEQDRLRKHIKLPAGAEQLIAAATAAPVGTFFDSDSLNVAVSGNLGDVIEVDLLDTVARQMLGLPAKNSDAGKNLDAKELVAATAKITAQEAKLRGFHFSVSTEWDEFTDPAKLPNNPNGMQLITDGIDEGSGAARLPRLVTLNGEGRPTNNEDDFNRRGIFFVAPNINAADMTRLRNGDRLTTEKRALFIFHYQEQDASGRWIDKVGVVDVTAHDYDATGAEIFFGDRPVDNPGYSAIQLFGEVGVGKANGKLDVFRVEQRLRYLGYPALGQEVSAGTNPTRVNNPIQDLRVNGLWQEDDQRAAYLFGKVINYGPQKKQLVTPPTRPAGSAMPESGAGRSDYFSALKTAATGAATAAKIETTGKFISYLNAYNAPHWVNIYDNLRRDGYIEIRSGMNASESLESYGTSWMRDWLRAYADTSPDLLTSFIKLNGMTDANHGKSPFAHGTHDLGMALDLGFVADTMLDVVSSQRSNEAATAGLSTVAVRDAASAQSRWSKQNAIQLLTATNAQGQNLVRDARGNNQVEALKNFLGLYSLTQKDRSFSETANGNTVTATRDTGDWESIGLVHERAGTDFVRTALFGDGTQRNGLIESVHVGSMKKNTEIGQLETIPNQNPLYDMRTVLDSLGITVTPVQGHHNHFHIYLRPPQAFAINNLSATGASRSVPLNSNIPPSTDSAISSGGIEMLFDNLQIALFVSMQEPPQIQVVVSRELGGKGDQPLKGLFEICKPLETQGRDGAYSYLAPGDAIIRLGTKADKTPRALQGAKVSVVEQPKLGSVQITDSIDREAGPVFKYSLNDGVAQGSEDTIVFEVVVNGNKYRVKQRLIVDFNVESSTGCDGEQLYIRRIRATLMDSPPEVSATWKLEPLDLLFEGQSLGVKFDWMESETGILGQSYGSGVNSFINISPTAAGHGWYLDPTPVDNTDDFLPTADKTIWRAKAGSAADGKMDLLSVPLHEYGHVLGLEHNGDSSDFMAATLQPGERRLPTEAELAWMAERIAQLKAEGDGNTDRPFVPSSPNLPALPGGTRTSSGSRLARRSASNVPPAPQFATAVNAALVNGSFNQSGTPNGAGWTTQGDVSFSADGATLGENGGRQARLLQGFAVGANDRLLSFTLAGPGLQANAGGPGDAFEVALLDADTGLPLLGDAGSVDLNGSDALLNRQTARNGQAAVERLAASVRKQANADGSVTYLVALAPELAGKSVLLSLDLLGFGSLDSHITVRDVHIGQSLKAVDDAAPDGVEDTPVTVDLLANDQVGSPATSTVQLLQAPLHGQATVDANGVLTYMPEANYFGTDSLTYQLLDSATGQVSNVATVSVQVAPVNDAPQAHADARVVSQDAAALEVAANEGVLQGHGPDATGRDSDADNDPLTVVGVTAGDRTSQSSDNPSTAGVGAEVQGSYGSLWLQADGAYRYVPNAMAQTLAAGATGLDVFTYTVADGQGGLATSTLILTVAGANDAPVAAGTVTGSLAEDGAVTLDLLAGATDVDGDALTAAVVSAPVHGSLLVLADGRFSYVPAPDFNGSDSFTYRVSDGLSASGLVTVALTVAAVNDAPMAQSLAFSMTGNGAAVVPLAATDVDNATAQLGYGIVTAPQHGSVSRQADGRWVYTPTAGYVGSDSFTYRANDGQLTSNVATVQVTVTAPPASTLAIELGVAGIFNVFALHNFTSTGSDTEGAIAAGNNLTLANYSVNAHGRAYHGLSAVVGGNFSFYGGSLHGTATYGGSQQSGQLSSGDVVRRAAPDFSFANEAARLTALSDQLATLPATGTVTAQWGGLFFTGDGKSAVQVFTISGADLMSANWSSFSKLSAGQTVIVNVTGSTAGFTGGTPNGFSAYNTLFNFSGAQTLNFNNVGVYGTILAPRAQVNGGGGQINGNVIVKDWNSGIQINANHYFQPSSVPLGTGATQATALQTPTRTALTSQAQSPAAALVATGLQVGSVLEESSHRFVITDQTCVANPTGWNIDQLCVVPPQGATATALPQVMAIHGGDTPAGEGIDANPYIRFTLGDGTGTPAAAAVGLIGREVGLLEHAPQTAAQRFVIRVLESSTSQYSFEVPLPGELAVLGARRDDDEDWLRDLERTAGKLWKELTHSPD